MQLYFNKYQSEPFYQQVKQQSSLWLLQIEQLHIHDFLWDVLAG